MMPTKSTCTRTAASRSTTKRKNISKVMCCGADVLEELSEDHFAQRVGDLIRPILTFRDDEPVSNIWELMLEKKEHISVIIDDMARCVAS